jgi:hypothetical protein
MRPWLLTRPASYGSAPLDVYRRHGHGNRAVLRRVLAERPYRSTLPFFGRFSGILVQRFLLLG